MSEKAKNPIKWKGKYWWLPSLRSMLKEDDGTPAKLVTSVNGKSGDVTIETGGTTVTGVTSYNGKTGAVKGVESFNGKSGAVTGVDSVGGLTGVIVGSTVRKVMIPGPWTWDGESVGYYKASQEIYSLGLTDINALYNQGVGFYILDGYNYIRPATVVSFGPGTIYVKPLDVAPSSLPTIGVNSFMYIYYL